MKQCERCNEIMTPVYENVGFQTPDPEKVELAYFKCNSCEYINDESFMNDKKAMAQDVS